MKRPFVLPPFKATCGRSNASGIGNHSFPVGYSRKSEVCNEESVRQVLSLDCVFEKYQRRLGELEGKLKLFPEVLWLRWGAQCTDGWATA
jgi:hypothetical protein